MLLTWLARGQLAKKVGMDILDICVFVLMKNLDTLAQTPVPLGPSRDVLVIHVDTSAHEMTQGLSTMEDRDRERT